MLGERAKAVAERIKDLLAGGLTIESRPIGQGKLPQVVFLWDDPQLVSVQVGSSLDTFDLEDVSQRRLLLGSVKMALGDCLLAAHEEMISRLKKLPPPRPSISKSEPREVSVSIYPGTPAEKLMPLTHLIFELHSECRAELVSVPANQG